MNTYPLFSTSAFHKSSQPGFSLVELLVAVVILAVGLLGMLSLQTAGFSMNQSNTYRAQASMLAQDMAERIRTSVDLANTEIAKKAQRAAYSVAFPNANLNCISSNNGCSLGDLARSDLWQWSEAVRTTLPGGTGTITRNNNSGAFTISVSWTDPSWNRTAGEPENKTIRLNVDLGS